MEEVPNQEQRKSKYNSAVSQLYRLDSLWQSCHLLKSYYTLLQWNMKLDAIWTELADDTTPKQDQKFDNFMILIVKYGNKKNILYQILIKKEIFLRKVQNGQGKGSAYENPDEDMMEE